MFIPKLQRLQFLCNWVCDGKRKCQVAHEGASVRRALSFEKAKLIEIDSKRVNGTSAAEGLDLYSRMKCRTVAVVELARRPAAQAWVKDA